MQTYGRLRVGQGPRLRVDGLLLEDTEQYVPLALADDICKEVFTVEHGACLAVKVKRGKMGVRLEGQAPPTDALKDLINERRDESVLFEGHEKLWWALLVARGKDGDLYLRVSVSAVKPSVSRLWQMRRRTAPFVRSSALRPGRGKAAAGASERSV